MTAELRAKENARLSEIHCGEADNMVKKEKEAYQFLESYGGQGATLDHTKALQALINEIDWKDYAQGMFDAWYLHNQLHLELSPDDLVAAGVPHYESLQKVVKHIDTTVNSTANVNNCHEALLDVKRRLLELERKFMNSQVDIDEMDHTDVEGVVETFRQAIVTSVAHIVEDLDQQLAEAHKQHSSLINEQLHKYATEADLVAKTSFARLRASRPEDEEDPWEVPKEARALKFESEIMQKWYEQEIADRVVEDYEEEWNGAHRRDVVQLVPRAKRLIQEFDEHESQQAADLLEEMMALCEKKGEVIDKTSNDTGEVASQLLGTMQQQCESVVQAGLAFKEKRIDQRHRSERDIQKIQDFVQTQRNIHLKKSEEFDELFVAEKGEIDASEAQMQRLREEIMEKQRQLLELGEARRERALQLAKSIEEEKQRVSQFNYLMSTTDEYLKKLESSLQNFILADGYNSILEGMAFQCKDIAQSIMDSQKSTLGGFLTTSVRQYADATSSAFHQLKLMSYRKAAKVQDLQEKATLSRKQREFCLATNDPIADRFKDAEAELLEMARKIEVDERALEERADVLQAKFEHIIELCEKLAIQLPYSTNLMEAPIASVQKHGHYITRASRAPLVNFEVESANRLVVPPVYFTDGREQRAKAAYGVG